MTATLILNVLFDVCEDFLDRSRTDCNLELIITFYDVRKAFDSSRLSRSKLPYPGMVSQRK